MLGEQKEKKNPKNGKIPVGCHVPCLLFCCCCCQVTSVVSERPHRWQPTRLPRPWDSPGKNTGVGCHFLLQCMKVKSESEVAHSCPTLSDPMNCSPPGSSVHGIFQARVLEWGALVFSGLLFWDHHKSTISTAASHFSVAGLNSVMLFLQLSH